MSNFATNTRPQPGIGYDCILCGKLSKESIHTIAIYKNLEVASSQSVNVSELLNFSNSQICCLVKLSQKPDLGNLFNYAQTRPTNI